MLGGLWSQSCVEEISTTQDNGDGPEYFVVADEEDGGYSYNSQDNGNDLCPRLIMSQPDDRKCYCQSTHQQSIGISALICIPDPSGDGKSRDHRQNCGYSRRDDRPPIFIGAEIKDEERQRDGEEKDRAKVGGGIATTSSHSRRNTQHTQNIGHEQSPGASAIIQINDEETQSNEEEE